MDEREAGGTGVGSVEAVEGRFGVEFGEAGDAPAVFAHYGFDEGAYAAEDVEGVVGHGVVREVDVGADERLWVFATTSSHCEIAYYCFISKYVFFSFCLFSESLSLP